MIDATFRTKLLLSNAAPPKKDVLTAKSSSMAKIVQASSMRLYVA
jgi:hypothetical protein